VSCEVRCHCYKLIAKRREGKICVKCRGCGHEVEVATEKEHISSEEICATEYARLDNQN